MGTTRALFFEAVGSQALPKDVFGVFERSSTYSSVIFTAILGIYGFCDTMKKEESVTA